MSDKVYVSVRFSDSFNNRISINEWNLFSLWLNKYFKQISNDQIVETALNFALEDKEGTAYEFNHKSFSKLNNILPKIICMESSLQRGFLQKKIIIQSRNISASAEIDSKIRYYPPYIISIEPTYEYRISMDLMKEVKNISEMKNEIIIEL